GSSSLGERDRGTPETETTAAEAGVVWGTDAPPLWVDLRKAPVAVIPSAVRRVVKAVEAVGGVTDGLVVQWAGARGASEAEDEEGRTA
ncbi:unnamed protein product, partial [Ectocarpus sp. 12 AP-2014]